MRASASTIWQVPAYLPYLQPPLTPDAVADAEEQIGYSLPAEYVELLRVQNGGYIGYSLPEMVHDTIAGIGPHFPSLTVFDWDEVQEHVSYPLDGLVPFDGDGHWHMCIDYRSNPTSPSVAYVDVECDSQSPVAASFAEYLRLLRRKVGEEHVLEGVGDVGAVIAVLGRALGVAFDPPDTWASGYPTYRAGLGKKDNPEWVWFSPNDVPRGFARVEESRYSELKDLLPGTAKRWPELPDGSHLLRATDGVRARVLAACERAGLSVKPLRGYISDG